MPHKSVTEPISKPPVGIMSVFQIQIRKRVSSVKQNRGLNTLSRFKADLSHVSFKGGLYSKKLSVLASLALIVCLSNLF